MEEGQLLAALSALAHPIRLSVYHRLARAAAVGLGPNAIADALALPRNLVSYHLQPLVHAGLVRSERRGRDVNYAVLPESMSRLALAILELKQDDVHPPG